jgi:folate-dependent phosphoribosylglycinamide formyltransferase PurN
MNELRVVVFTRGGLGLPVSQRLAALPGVRLAGVLCQRWVPRKRPLVERLRRHVRYSGYAGAAAELARAVGERLSPRASAAESRGEEEALARIAEEAGAMFRACAEVHDTATLEWARETGADLGVVVGSGILKPELFDLPRLGSINVHQGKVPEYRGSAPLFWALYEGETETRITIHQVVERVDAGAVILEQAVPLAYDYARYGTDFERFIEDYRAGLAEPSVNLMVEAVRRISLGCEQRIAQDESRAMRRRMPTYPEKQALRRILRQRYGTGEQSRSYSPA